MAKQSNAFQNYYRSMAKQADDNKWEALFDQQLMFAGIGGVVKDFRFHPLRRWEIDRAIPQIKLGLEIQGAIWVQSKHTTGTGIQRDIDKMNAAHELGWILLLASGDMVKDGRALDLFKRFIDRLKP